MLARVITSQIWDRYYVLKKSRMYFEEVFGVRAPTICGFVEQNMLTSAVEEGDYV
ncbi:MAG: hypothetical protein HY280_01715 [Nitrospinae bacterium]|nr:hypothetical protein [Nitrospinota bacterium]